MEKIFSVRRSRTGLGLFARSRLERGQFIVEYTGERILTSRADERNPKFLFEINSRWTIDGSSRKNLARYLNHSCFPNAKAEIKAGRIRIFARKVIREGEEITLHYGYDYFSEFIGASACKCLHCRG
jgi:SET domain-containing protein